MTVSVSKNPQAIQRNIQLDALQELVQILRDNPTLDIPWHYQRLNVSAYTAETAAAWVRALPNKADKVYSDGSLDIKTGLGPTFQSPVWGQYVPMSQEKEMELNQRKADSYNFDTGNYEIVYTEADFAHRKHLTYEQEQQVEQWNDNNPDAKIFLTWGPYAFETKYHFPVCIEVPRNEVCERVVVGTEMRETLVYPTVEPVKTMQEVEIVEWKCKPLLDS